MTKNEIVQKNIAFFFDFIRYLVKYPDLLEGIPEGTEVEFVERDLAFRAAKSSVSGTGNTIIFNVEHTFKEMALD